MAHGPDTGELLRRINRCNQLLRILCKCNDILNVSYLNITSLPTLPSSIRELKCSYTQLTTLPTLPSGLTHLYCSHTPLTTLPDLPSGLKYLNCSHTPLILQRGANESIRDYNARWNEWRELEMSKKRCQERSRVIHEELCASAWRPARVQKWIEIGGLDILDTL